MRRRRKKEKQEVGDNSGVCVLNLLPEVSTLPRLPSLVAITLVTVEISFFHLSYYFTMVTCSKAHVTLKGERLSC